MPSLVSQKKLREIAREVKEVVDSIDWGDAFNDSFYVQEENMQETTPIRNKYASRHENKPHQNGSFTNVRGQRILDFEVVEGASDVTYIVIKAAGRDRDSAEAVSLMFVVDQEGKICAMDGAFDRIDPNGVKQEFQPHYLGTW